MAGAREALLAAAADARRSAAWPRLADAALGLGGTGLEVALFDETQTALLEEALRELGPNDVALRSRVSARLSVALSLVGQEPRRATLSQSAVDLAQAAADPAALAEALAARCDAHAGPEHMQRRVDDATEILRVAQARGDRGIELLGRRLRLLARLEAGDVAAADAEIQAFDRVARWLRQPRYGWYVPLWQAMRAAMRGRLVEQQRLAAEAEAIGRAAGSVNIDILLLAHRWFTWLEAGEMHTAVDHLDAQLPPGGYAEMGPQMTPGFVMQRLLAGRPDEARALLDHAADDLLAAPRDAEWLTMLAQVADACFQLGGHELVPWLYDTLAPFAQLWSVDGMGAYAHGPVHRQLGLLAALLGHRADAAAHFDAALAGNRRAGADLLVARTLLDRGVALGEPVSLRATQQLYRELDVPLRVEEIDARLRGAAAPPSDGQVPDRGELRRAGEVWTITFAGHQASVRDVKGIRDIVALLAAPRREIAALDLAAPAPGSPAPRGDLGEPLDARARAAYKARLVELEHEIDEADAGADLGRSARAQAEREALLAQLSAAYGLGGRPRRAGDPAERARTTVTTRIRDAIRRIEAAHPEAGRHLARAIRTGTFCRYDPDRPVRWTL